MSDFKELELGPHCNAVVLAWLKEESECFPVAEWGMRGEGWGQTSSDSTVAGCCGCENVSEG